MTWSNPGRAVVERSMRRYHYGMKLNGRYLIVGVLALFFVVMPLTLTQGQGLMFVGDTGVPGLVPCGNTSEIPCNLCYFETLIQEVMRLLIYAAVFIATLMIAYAGFLFVTAAGDSGKITKGKDVFLKAMIGLFFILAAWLIVSTLMNFLLGRGFTWTSFGTCVPTHRQAERSSDTPAQTGGVAAVPPSQAPAGCTNCQAVASKLPIKTGACAASQCVLDPDLNQRLLNFQQEFAKKTPISSDGWTITEAYPPTRSHLNACHSNGTCIDANFRTLSPTPTNIVNFQQAAQQSNLRAVYEVTSTARKDQLVQSGVPVNSIQVVPSATGEHFSMYKI